MSAHLEKCDWKALAQKSGFKASNLAAACGMSLRTLERYLKRNVGLSPRQFLRRLQRAESARLKREGLYAKEIAVRLGYKHTSSYCRGTRLGYRSISTEKIVAKC